MTVEAALKSLILFSLGQDCFYGIPKLHPGKIECIKDSSNFAFRKTWVGMS